MKDRISLPWFWVLGVAIALLICIPAHAANPVSITLNPSTGVLPYTSTLTWSAQGAVSCTASGAWTGTKSATGSLSVSVTNATPYALTCSYNDGTTTTTWTPPTTNTDGSAYTDNAGYAVYRGTTTTNLTRIKALGPTITSYTDAGLATGSYYYAVTSVNAASQESAQGRSTPYPIQVTASTASASATPGVTTVPSAPGGVITTTTAVSVNVTTTTGVAPAQ